MKPDLSRGRPAGFPGMASGWVFYDAVCPLCRATISRFGGALEQRGFRFAALQEPWVAQELGILIQELRREVKLLRADGAILGGADAVRELARSVPWLRPIAWVSGLPGFRWVSEASYGWVAANRYCLSDVCGLPAADCGKPRHGAGRTLELP